MFSLNYLLKVWSGSSPKDRDELGKLIEEFGLRRPAIEFLSKQCGRAIDYNTVGMKKGHSIWTIPREQERVVKIHINAPPKLLRIRLYFNDKSNWQGTYQRLRVACLKGTAVNPEPSSKKDNLLKFAMDIDVEPPILLRKCSDAKSVKECIGTYVENVISIATDSQGET